MIEPITTGLLVGSSLLGAGSSMLGAGKSSRAAGSAMDQQRQLSMQDLAFRQQLFDYERQMTGPAREKLRDMAMSDEPLYYGDMSNRIKQNYAQALRGISGLNYGNASSGLRSNALQTAKLNMASDLGGAYAQGLQGRTNLLQEVAGSDRSLQAGMNYSQGLGNLGQFYGQQAGMYNQAAAQGWQNFGQNLSGLAYGLAAMGSQPQRPAYMDWKIDAPATGGALPANPIDPTTGYQMPIGWTPPSMGSVNMSGYGQPLMTGANMGTYGQPLSYGVLNPSTSGYGVWGR